MRGTEWNPHARDEEDDEDFARPMLAPGTEVLLTPGMPSDTILPSTGDTEQPTSSRTLSGQQSVTSEENQTPYHNFVNAIVQSKLLLSICIVLMNSLTIGLSLYAMQNSVKRSFVGAGQDYSSFTYTSAPVDTPRPAPIDTTSPPPAPMSQEEGDETDPTPGISTGAPEVGNDGTVGQEDGESNGQEEEGELTCDSGLKLFRLELKTDVFGHEVSWHLKDCFGEEIQSKNGLEELYTGTVIEQICLQDNKAYVFTIEDAGGDGVCCSYGDGSYEVYYGGEIVGSGGDFGSSATRPIGGSCP
ncbi:peptidase M4 thermolysin [Seminavis robusta]|uniref:Peptidase M4 thermolysin n=1 Tax=Seminavis robusta TaxID=568900 RepID=A0A9N8E3S0_9STRA|nr:peptidase M4 thermolysin [Seminavis robusta]|eukprot:Sro624_g177250.1 peptidase M4 thermolysin (301) ;mRNA; f:4265-5167